MMTDTQIRTARAVLGQAMDLCGAMSEDAADDRMARMMEIYEPGMSAAELVAATL